MVTANVTSFASAKSWIPTVRAHIILLQEHRIIAEEDIEEASHWCKRNSYVSLWAPAVLGPAGRPSGGVAILVNEQCGLFVPPASDHVLIPGRAAAGMVELPGLSPFMVVAVYFQVGLGLAGTNLDILQGIGECSERWGVPFLAGGDFNSGPRALMDSGFTLRAGAVTASPREPTCITKRSRSVIDFFLGSRAIMDLVSSIRVDKSADLATHRPVILEFTPEASKLHALILVKPSRLPCTSPYGPRPMPGDWGHVKAATKAALHIAREEAAKFGSGRGLPSISRVDGAMSEAYRAFANMAEKELASITGEIPAHMGRRASPPKLVRRQVQPDWKTAFKPWSSQARPYRWLLLRARMCHSIIYEDLPSAATWLCAVQDIIDDIKDEVPLYVSECAEAKGFYDSLVALMSASLADSIGSRWQESRPCAMAAIDEIHSQVDECLNRQVCIDRSASSARWKAWAAEAGRGGAGAAHKWSKSPVGWRPTVASHRGSWSGLPTSILEQAADKYAGLWDSGPDSLVAPNHGRVHEYMLDDGAITGRQIIEASSSFSAHSAQTYDGFHVRHWSLLGEDACECTADILRICTAFGFMPRPVRAVIAFMIPKAKGGHRALGLFPAAYRVGMKAMRHQLRDWESSHRRPYYSFSSGNSCVMAVWQQAARAEAATSGPRGAFGSILWDMSDYYEHIPRPLLRDRGDISAFPAHIMDLSISMYGATRILTLETLAKPMGRPGRGVIAGCTAATYHVQSFAAPPLDTFREVHVHIDLNLHVDDLIMHEGAVSESIVAQDLALAAADMRLVIANELKCKISVPKAAMAASSAKLLKRLGKALGDLGHYRQASAENLGIDFAGGRTRRSYLGKSRAFKRFAAVKARLGRVRKLGKAAKATAAKVFSTGLNPALSYGAEVQGFDNAQVRDFQSIQLSSVGMFGKGKSRTIALALVDDRAWEPACAPIVMWARMVWAAGTCSSEHRNTPDLRVLIKWWRDTRAKLPLKWQSSRGPFGAMHLSMQRLGWTPTGPLSFRDAQGVSHAILAIGPKLVSALAKRDWMMGIRQRASESLGMTGDERLDLYRARKLLLGKTPFIALERGTLINFLIQGVWTRQRLDALGYQVDDMTCALCGEGVDNLTHRLLECSASKADRDEALTSDEVGRLLTEPACRWARVGLATDPSRTVPRPASEGDTFWHRDGSTLQAFFAGGGDFYLDGSCAKEWHPSLNRASWAIVRVDNDGVLEGSLSGPVWGNLPQTSPCAEFVAYAAAAQHAQPHTCLHVDYQGVCTAHRSSNRLSFNKAFAGVVRSAVTHDNWRNIRQVCKVKAHQDLFSLDMMSPQWLQAKGNHLADAAAKSALGFHPGLGELDGLKILADLAVKVCRLAAKVLPLWPTESGHLQKVAPLEVRPPPAHPSAGSKVAPVEVRPSPAHPPEDTHEHEHMGRPQSLGSDEASHLVIPLPLHVFVWRHGVYRCEGCLMKATTEQGMLQRRGSKCPGESAAIARAVSADLGHKIFGFKVIPSGEGLLGCIRCGAFCTSMPRALAKACPGRPAHTESKFAIAAMSDGRHPQRVKAKQGFLLTEGVPFDRQLFADIMD